LQSEVALRLLRQQQESNSNTSSDVQQLRQLALKQQELINKLVLHVKKQQQIIDKQDDRFEKLRRMAIVRHIDTVHPGWIKLVGTDGYKTWEKTQPTVLREAAAAFDQEAMLALIEGYLKYADN